MESPTEEARSELSVTHRLKTLLAYGLMIGLAVTAFLMIRSAGEHLVAPAATGAAEAKAIGGGHASTLMHVLLALTVVIVTARAMGAVFGWMQQPPVIGEIIGGILLGPSLLGRIAPEVSGFLLPPSVAPFLGIIAQLGIILYMFLVGLELDLKVIRRSGHATLAISHASIIVPFLLGAGLALGLYPVMSNDSVPFTVFALFMGISLSITAFPVLARILTDRSLSRTKMGAIALTCAAVDDATAWCLLAFVVSIAQAKMSSAVVTVVLTVIFVVGMLVVARPWMQRLTASLDSSPDLTKTGMTIIFVAMLVSSLTTELIGIHAIFGAFLLGAVIPNDSRVAHELRHRMEDVLAVLFLPAFFAFTGMRTQMDLIGGSQNWLICGGIILVACLGKYGGTIVSARAMGLNWRDSSALGILMNTRGLVELIVLNIGLDLKVISPTLFAMLVIMALVTTFMTTPILHLHLRRHPWENENAGPAAASAGYAGTIGPTVIGKS